jgi:hypothetical protein
VNGNSEPPSAFVVTRSPEENVVVEDAGVDKVGAVGDAPEQAAAKTQKPITTYRICSPQRDSVSETRLNKVLPPRGVVIFLTFYRRRLRAETLMRRTVTEKWRFRDESRVQA